VFVLASYWELSVRNIYSDLFIFDISIVQCLGGYLFRTQCIFCSSSYR